MIHKGIIMVELYWAGKHVTLGQKFVPVALCPPQTSRSVVWDRNRASTA